MAAPTPARAISLPSPPKSFTICGYIRELDGSLATIDGCADAPWGSLPREYFFRGVRRHVTADRTSCKIRITATTVGSPTVGAYVRITTCITPYKFYAGGALVAGWNIGALTIKKISILGREVPQDPS